MRIHEERRRGFDAGCMNFFTLIFGAFVVVALVTGKAYFRGVATRDDNPNRYWTIVACYAMMAVAGLIFAAIPGGHGRNRASSSLVPSFMSDFLTDGATRIARDLEEGAVRARHAPDGQATVIHEPKASPEGCADDYRVQLTKDSALVIWCSTDGKVTSSHITTSHLPEVAVPQTWIVDKKAGEALTISLERRGNRVAVTDVQ